MDAYESYKRYCESLGITPCSRIEYEDSSYRTLGTHGLRDKGVKLYEQGPHKPQAKASAK